MQEMLPLINRPYPFGFYYQRSSGIQRADLVNNFNEREKIPYGISGPTYSRDISSLENIWSWLKGEVAKDCPHCLRSSKNSIKKIWSRFRPQFLAPYFNSMLKRMELLIENKGGKINC